MLLTIFFTSTRRIFPYSIERNICYFSFSFFHFSYTSTIFRLSLFFCLFIAIFANSIERFSLSLFPFIPLSTTSSSGSHLTVSLIRNLVPLSHFSLSRGRFLFFASRSSFATRARDADAVCRTRTFAFSLRVTEHSIEPGRTVPSGQPSSPAYPFLYSALSSRFLSTSRFYGSYPNRERHQHTPVPLFPASSQEN